MSQPIRVLHIMSSWVLGGVQRVLLSYDDQLPKDSVVFDYVVQSQGDPQTEAERLAADSRIFRIPEMTRHPLSSMVALYRLLKQHPEYRIVHAHGNDLNLLPLLAAKLAGVPVRISHSHSCRPCPSLLKRFLKRIVHCLLKLVATDYWACSRVAYAWLYDQPYPENDANSYIMHNALDAGRFAFSPAMREQYRKELGLRDAFTCICVGTLSINKNQQYLLRVLEKLQQWHVDVKLLLVGDGECRHQLQQISSQLKLEDKVLFLGNRQDVADLLNAADCMLFPSLFEGLSVSVVEGQANGLPCVVSSATPQEVQFSRNMRFLDTTDHAVDEWAAAVCELARCRTDRNFPMDEAVARGGFDIHKGVDRLVERYKELSAACEIH